MLIWSNSFGALVASRVGEAAPTSRTSSWSPNRIFCQVFARKKIYVSWRIEGDVRASRTAAVAVGQSVEEQRAGCQEEMYSSMKE